MVKNIVTIVVMVIWIGSCVKKKERGESGLGGTNDTIPPTVKIVSPAEGVTVKNAITISADAHDNIGISKIEIYVDGDIIGEGNSVEWETYYYNDGDHSIHAKAWDDSSNWATSEPVKVKTANSQSLNVNCLINSGFESGESGWHFNDEAEVTESTSHSGYKSGYMYHPEWTSHYGRISQSISFHYENGQKYEVTFWHKGDRGGLALITTSQTEYFDIPSASDWHYYEVEIGAPYSEPGVFREIMFEVSGYSLFTQLYIDDVVFKRTE